MPKRVPRTGAAPIEIEPDSDADIGFGRTNAVGWVESDPANIRNKCFSPSVPGFLINSTIG